MTLSKIRGGEGMWDVKKKLLSPKATIPGKSGPGLESGYRHLTLSFGWSQHWRGKYRAILIGYKCGIPSESPYNLLLEEDKVFYDLI